jgi:hypothetical protein
VTGEIDQARIIVDIRKSTSGTFYVDTCEFKEGMAPAAWGDIQLQLLNDLSVDHTAEAGVHALDALGYLDYTSFTAAKDSAGEDWSPATVEYRAKRGKKMSHINTDGVRTPIRRRRQIGAHRAIARRC